MIKGPTLPLTKYRVVLRGANPPPDAVQDFFQLSARALSVPGAPTAVLAHGASKVRNERGPGASVDRYLRDTDVALKGLTPDEKHV